MCAVLTLPTEHQIPGKWSQTLLRVEGLAHQVARCNQTHFVPRSCNKMEKCTVDMAIALIVYKWLMTCIARQSHRCCSIHRSHMQWAFTGVAPYTQATCSGHSQCCPYKEWHCHITKGYKDDVTLLIAREVTSLLGMNKQCVLYTKLHTLASESIKQYIWYGRICEACKETKQYNYFHWLHNNWKEGL